MITSTRPSAPRVVRILLTLLSLLILATSASAECAWVLWREATLSYLATDVPDSTPLADPKAFSRHVQQWEIYGAYKARDDCIAQIAIVNSGKPEPQTVVSGGRVVALRTTDLNCLPDTVDPRGPKGK